MILSNHQVELDLQDESDKEIQDVSYQSISGDHYVSSILLLAEKGSIQAIHVWRENDENRWFEWWGFRSIVQRDEVWRLWERLHSESYTQNSGDIQKYPKNYQQGLEKIEGENFEEENREDYFQQRRPENWNEDYEKEEEDKEAEDSQQGQANSISTTAIFCILD